MAVSLVAGGVRPLWAAEPRFARPFLLTGQVRSGSAMDDNRTVGVARRYDCAATGTYDQHGGTDFLMPIGNPIYAGRSGGLFKSYNACPTYGSWESGCGNGFGNHVRIDHEGNYYDGLGTATIYAHMMQWGAANPMSVRCGGWVGASGSSGRSTGPHLHFEIRRYTTASAWTSLDPYAGACSQPDSRWTGLGTDGMPYTSCEF